MSFGPEHSACLDRTKPQQQKSTIESVLHVPRMVDRRPWLAHAFTELLKLQRTGRLEPGIGDFRVTDETLNTAGRVLGSIKYRYLPNPSLYALPGGGIQITWSS